MILRALLYAVAVFVLTGIISLVVAGIILLLFRSIRRNETKKELSKVESKPVSPENQATGKENA